MTCSSYELRLAVAMATATWLKTAKLFLSSFYSFLLTIQQLVWSISVLFVYDLLIILIICWRPCELDYRKKCYLLRVIFWNIKDTSVYSVSIEEKRRTRSNCTISVVIFIHIIKGCNTNACPVEALWCLNNLRICSSCFYIKEKTDDFNMGIMM
jgi:hypothetical protein